MRKIRLFVWRVGRLLYGNKTLRNLMPDKLFLYYFWHQSMGTHIDFKNVNTFNEKLTWLKYYDRKPLYTFLVDKYAVKQWVADRIGQDYLIPTVGLYNNVNEIDIDELPDRFVMKCTHDSGSTIICKDKSQFDFESAFAQLSNALCQDYYLLGREWPYKNVPRKILIEEYIEDSSIKELRDYKFFVFNGQVKFFKVDFDRFSNHRANYYDLDCNLLPFGENVCPPDFSRKIEIPDNIKDVINLVETLARDIPSPFERIDFYVVNGKAFFGEITFFPSGGHGSFTLPEWDDILGSWINLDSVVDLTHDNKNRICAGKL